MLVIRDVRDDDDLDAINSDCRGWVSQEFLRGAFASLGDAPRAMWIAEVDGRPVGYAHAVGYGVADGHRGLAHVCVRAEHRRGGIGAMLWQRVLATCTAGHVPGIAAVLDDADLLTKQIAVAHGWQVAGLHVLSRLDLTTYEQPRTRVPDGVEIRPLGVDLDEQQWLAFAALFHRVEADTPDAVSGTDGTPDEVIRSTLAKPWQVMGAWRGTTLIAFTSLVVGNRPARHLETMMTGVDRGERGQGVATAIKAAHAGAVRDAGWLTIGTLNMAGNEPILASNRTVGFREVGAIRDLYYDF